MRRRNSVAGQTVLPWIYAWSARGRRYPHFIATSATWRRTGPTYRPKPGRKSLVNSFACRNGWPRGDPGVETWYRHVSKFCNSGGLDAAMPRLYGVILLFLRQQGIRFFKPARHLGAIERLFAKTLCVPFAARDAEKISAINMQRGRQPRDRIGDGVNDVAPQRLSVFCGKGARTCSFN